jgi:trehalose synthase
MNATIGASDRAREAETMTHLKEVHLSAEPIERFAALLGEAHVEEAEKLAQVLRPRLTARVVWHVNSSMLGGGVAEQLQSLLAYSRGLGIDTRWLVMQAGPDFFRLAKRLHHALQGFAGDGSPLDESGQRLYQATLQQNARELTSLVRPRDIVVLHDASTAGLAPDLLRAGAFVIWRCHVGDDKPNDEVEQAWRFLSRYLQDVPLFVFSRPTYVPDAADPGKAAIVRPSIDAFSPKNEDLDEQTVRSILVHVGLVEGPAPSRAPHVFQREDETPGRVQRCADVIRLGSAPAWETPLVVQISRWDPLKDPIGVLRGFAQLVEQGEAGHAELVLAGPNVKAVADDPEAWTLFDQLLAAWRGLAHGVRRRVHLACLPTADVEEHAAIVNALQRHAAVIVQKSLREGFGLAVTEAMWKGRPVVASAVGGMQDQIEDGASGILLPDPSDPVALAAALRRVLGDPALAQRLGEAARERVRERYVGVRCLVEYGRLIERIGA